MNIENLYDKFLEEIQRLNFDKPLQRIAIDYIYKQIPDNEAIRLFNQGLPTFNTAVLKHQLVYEATIKALYVMANSNSKSEFANKIQQYIANNESVNFDEILYKLLNIKP